MENPNLFFSTNFASSQQEIADIYLRYARRSSLAAFSENAEASLIASIASHKFCPGFWQFNISNKGCTQAALAKGSVCLITVLTKRR